MKLMRNVTPDGQCKYAVVRMDKMALIAPDVRKDAETALWVLQSMGLLENPADDDQAWDRNAERLTAEALGTDKGRINPDATSVDDLFTDGVQGNAYDPAGFPSSLAAGVPPMGAGFQHLSDDRLEAVERTHGVEALEKFCTCKPGGFECDGCRINRERHAAGVKASDAIQRCMHDNDSTCPKCKVLEERLKESRDRAAKEYGEGRARLANVPLTGDSDAPEAS
jgi:hypothetical protein